MPNVTKVVVNSTTFFFVQLLELYMLYIVRITSFGVYFDSKPVPLAIAESLLNSIKDSNESAHIVEA